MALSRMAHLQSGFVLDSVLTRLFRSKLQLLSSADVENSMSSPRANHR